MSKKKLAENCDVLPHLHPVPPRPPTKRPRTSSPTTASTDWESENVRKKRETKEDAEENVLKFQLICVALECKKCGQDGNCLKTQLDKAASRFRHLSVSTIDNLTKLAVAYYKDTSKKQTETKLEWANAELRGAKSELEKAEAALEKAKAEVSAAEFATYVKLAWSDRQLSIASLSAGAVGKAQGMAELVRVIKDSLGNFVHLKKMGKNLTVQSTVAFVLTSSSGVGKTFFSLAAAKLLSKELEAVVGTLYLGFNSGAPFQQKESEFIQQNQTYDSVQLVLYRRLLIQLECLLALKEQPQKGTCKPFEFDEYGLQHVVKMEAKALASLPLLANDLAAAQERAVELLKKVRTAYELTHLMLVIDEGQKLDKLIKPASETGGARFALRWTRDLQLAAVNGNCGLLCFGLLTGIDPETSLEHHTDGKNHELWHMPMTLLDFKELTKVALEVAMSTNNAMSNKPCNVTLSEALINLVAASYFPHARAVREVKFADTGTVSLPVLQIRNHFDETTRRNLVVGAIGRFPLSNTAWARTSAWTECGDRFPCLSYAGTVELLSDDIFSSLPRDKLTVNDCYEFEALAAATLQLLIWVRGEVLVNANRWPLGEQLMQRIFPDSTVCLKMKSAFPDTIRSWFSEYPTDAKQMYYPSSICKSHDAAFEVRTKPPPPHSAALATEFKKNTDKLDHAPQNGANTLFFRCGGSAPIDFVILHKTSQTAWLLTLADAKHTGKQEGSKPSAKDMASKGDMVFRYLEHRLKADYKVTLKWDRTVLLLTNADDAAVSEVPLETAQAEPVTIVRLTPSTFKMGSVTDYLFARCASVAPGEVWKEEKFK